MNDAKKNKLQSQRFEKAYVHNGYIRPDKIIEYTDDVSEHIRALYPKITINLEEYFQGNYDLNGIRDRLQKYYHAMKSYCMNEGLLIDSDEAYKSQLLRDIYRSYRYKALLVAIDMNEREGKTLTSRYLSKETTNVYFYYNSDYYYKCEILRDKLTNIVNELASNEKINHFETESIDKRKRYVYDYQFNYVWFWKYQRDEMKNIKEQENLIPPKHFKVFYYRNLKQVGKLIIYYKSEKVELDISKARPEQEWKLILDFIHHNSTMMAEESQFITFFHSFYLSIINKS